MRIQRAVSLKSLCPAPTSGSLNLSTASSKTTFVWKFHELTPPVRIRAALRPHRRGSFGEVPSHRRKRLTRKLTSGQCAESKRPQTRRLYQAPSIRLRDQPRRRGRKTLRARGWGGRGENSTFRMCVQAGCTRQGLHRTKPGNTTPIPSREAKRAPREGRVNFISGPCSSRWPHTLEYVGSTNCTCELKRKRGDRKLGGVRCCI